MKNLFYDFQQFNFELQNAVRLDIRASSTFSVSQFRRNPEDIFRTNRHQLQTFCPAFDNLVNTKFCRFATINRAVELGSVQQSSRIMNFYTVFFCRFCSRTFCDNLILQTTFCSDYAALCFIFS